MLIFYDGECLFCESWVRVVIKKSNDPNLKFIPIQLSNFASKKLLLESQTPSMIVIDLNSKQVYLNSKASLFVMKNLKGFYGLIGKMLWYVPRFISDAIYNFIGRNRNKFFGRKSSCTTPTDLEESFFLYQKEEIEDCIRIHAIDTSEIDSQLNQVHFRKCENR